MPCKAVFPMSVGAAKVEVDARSFARDSSPPSVAEPLSDRRGPEQIEATVILHYGR